MANDSPEQVDDVARSAKSGLSGGAYLAITLLIFIAISFTTIGLLIKPAGWLPKQQDSLSSQFIYFFTKRKLEISEKLQGPRFVVLGGSGSLYSVRAAQLSRALEKNVVNWGTQADLGLGYLLFNAKRVLRQGDTVILVLEYSQYVSAGPSWTLADYVIPNDLAYLQTLAPQELISLLGELTISEYARKVFDRWQGSLADGSLALEAINDAGDLIVNNQVDQRSHHIESLSRYPRDGPADIEQGCSGENRRFSQVVSGQWDICRFGVSSIFGPSHIPHCSVVKILFRHKTVLLKPRRANSGKSERLFLFKVLQTFLWVSSTLSRMVCKENVRWTAWSCTGNCLG